MNDPQPSSLILERRIRGHLPVTRFSVSADGSVMLATPDKDQSRLYHLGMMSHTGDWGEISDFSVEKLAAWDISASGDTFIAATDDVLYVFRGGQKTRLLTDRRDSYLAASITADGESFAVASSDLLQSAYGVTLASTDGTGVRTKDLQLTLTCAQISPDGSCVAAGSEEGVVVLLSSDRQVIWEFDAGEPISTVCIPSSSGPVIVGTRSGTLMAIEEAEKKWEAGGDGPVTACTATLDGRLVVAARNAVGACLVPPCAPANAVGACLVPPGGDDHVPDGSVDRAAQGTPLQPPGDGDMHAVECLSDDGRPLAEFTAPSAVTSVACSDDGRYVAVSCRDGSLLVFEIQGRSSRMADAQRASDLYANALAMAERGDLDDAVPALVRTLELDPRNADAAGKLAETAHSLVRESLSLADESLARNDRAEAARRIETAWGNCVYAPDLAGEVVGARKKAVQGMLRCARDAEVEDALGILSVLLRLDATNAEARELLGRLEDEVTDRLLREADGALTSGHASEAVRLLEQAYDRAPSDAVREKLSRARCDEALAEGLAFYEVGRYPQAIAQFRKVLGIDPANAEAQKHLDYAEKLAQDDALSDRFTRLE